MVAGEGQRLRAFFLRFALFRKMNRNKEQNPIVFYVKKRYI